MWRGTAARFADVVARPAAAPPARWALAGLSLCMLLSSLDTSIANVALPTLAQAFGASFQQVQWVVLSYLLAVTTLIVGAGRLGDLVGRRRLLLAGVALFTVASVPCGGAPTLGLLVVGRASQGLGGAIMMALTLALVGEAVPEGRTGHAMGLLGTMSAVGTALGPSLGGLLIAWAGWRSIFLVNLPLGALAFLLAHRALPADRYGARAGRGGFDPLGTLLLALALGAYALALTVGHGRFGPLNLARNVGRITGAAAMGAVFALGSGTIEVSTAAPGAVASGLRTTFGVAGLLVVVALAISARAQRPAAGTASPTSPPAPPAERCGRSGSRGAGRREPRRTAPSRERRARRL